MFYRQRPWPTSYVVVDQAFYKLVPGRRSLTLSSALPGHEPEGGQAEGTDDSEETAGGDGEEVVTNRSYGRGWRTGGDEAETPQAEETEDEQAVP